MISRTFLLFFLAYSEVETIRTLDMSYYLNNLLFQLSSTLQGLTTVRACGAENRLVHEFDRLQVGENIGENINPIFP